MTIIEKLREWEREAEITFADKNPDRIEGIRQGLNSAIELLEKELNGESIIDLKKQIGYWKKSYLAIKKATKL